MAALQKSGDTEWRKRISKPVVGSPSASAGEMDEATNSDGDIASKGSIADRLKVLETAQKGWRTRVHEPDAARFTVAGKMGQRPVSVHVLSSETIKHKPISPMLDRKMKTPKPVPLRLKNADGSAVSDSSPGTTPSTDDVKPPFNRSTSDPSSTPSRLIVTKAFHTSFSSLYFISFHFFLIKSENLEIRFLEQAKSLLESCPFHGQTMKRSPRSSLRLRGRWPRHRNPWPWSSHPRRSLI